MITWGTILYGAVLSGAAAGVALVLLAGRQRSVPVLVAGVVAAVACPIGWNAILRATHASNFFTDAPLAVFPASWQDFGSGVFTVAGSAIVLGLGPMRSTSAARLVKVAALCGLMAFVVDVYLY
jgi:hypothetical protein